MKILRPLIPSRAEVARRLSFMGVALAALILCLTPARADETKETDADKAWQEVEKASQPPTPPAEWQTVRPSPQDLEKWRDLQRESIGEAIDKATDFHTRFPGDPRAADARKKEYDLLNIAVRMGSTNRLEQLQAAEKRRLEDPNLSEGERFDLRVRAAQHAAMKHRGEGMPAVMVEFEKQARLLQKDFPDRPEVYEMLLDVASASDGDKARALAKEIAESKAENEVKEKASALLKKLEALGKPLSLKYTAVDGREVDLSRMKDKVVLVDFWATWCGPCVQELPNVKAAYDKLHAKGFEIIGISFDSDKAKLEKFVADKQMAWPQYFDGKGWENSIGAQYAIHSIPTMWLVDKKGILRDMHARQDLTAKVERLLDE